MEPDDLPAAADLGRTCGRSSGYDGDRFARDLAIGGTGRGFGESRTRSPSHRGRVEDEHLGNKLYVGNLPFSITEDELRTLFEQHGAVQSVSVITDRETGRARGFAFVEFQDASSAEAAQQALNGSDLGGRVVGAACYYPQLDDRARPPDSAQR